MEEVLLLCSKAGLPKLKPKVDEMGHFRKFSSFPASTYVDTALLEGQEPLERFSFRRAERWRRLGVISGVDGARKSRSCVSSCKVFIAGRLGSLSWFKLVNEGRSESEVFFSFEIINKIGRWIQLHHQFNSKLSEIIIGKTINLNIDNGLLSSNPSPNKLMALGALIKPLCKIMLY